MPTKKVSRNSPCPCGSGKKYKQCCSLKGIEYREDDQGASFRQIPLTKEMAGVLDQQRRKFIERHGREPGPNDRIFFDLPHPEQFEHELVETMKKAGIDPAIIHAFEKTGRLVTEDNRHLVPDVELAEWDAAIKEYEAQQGRRD
jgi:hypothetical protein